jgi:hypothetical protein
VRYEAIPEMSREQIEKELAGGDPQLMSYAILSASLYDSDWQWAQSVCLRFLDYPEKWVRWNAATGLSHIARIHGRLDTEIVVPRLKAQLNDPEVASNVEDSLTEIDWSLRSDRDA